MKRNMENTLQQGLVGGGGGDSDHGGEEGGEGTTESEAEEYEDLRHELLRRLRNMQIMDNILLNTWAWDVLYYLDESSNDLWTLIVYAGCLLRRSNIFNPPCGCTLDQQRKLVLAALTVTVKLLHDGTHRLKLCDVATEVDFCQRLIWKLRVTPEEYEEASWRWIDGPA